MYSSGMKARLAFAIATCVGPDVLIVDEVLSVGDAVFKQKSGARMRELISRARAILQVSHAIGTIRELCNVAVWLEKGQIKAHGPTDEVIKSYERWQQLQPAHCAK